MSIDSLDKLIIFVLRLRRFLECRFINLFRSCQFWIDIWINLIRFEINRLKIFLFNFMSECRDTLIFYNSLTCIQFNVH